LNDGHISKINENRHSTETSSSDLTVGELKERIARFESALRTLAALRAVLYVY
jgi:hypothetical protein